MSRRGNCWDNAPQEKQIIRHISLTILPILISPLRDRKKTPSLYHAFRTILSLIMPRTAYYSKYFLCVCQNRKRKKLEIL